MTRVFLDSNIFLYATGAEHPCREPCRALLLAMGAGTVAGETSVEVLQEVVHVRARRSGSRRDARALAERAGRACTVHSFEPEDLERALEIFVAGDSLPMRDAVHAAVALRRGSELIASADKDFDRIPDVVRVDPLDESAVNALVEAP